MFFARTFTLLFYNLTAVEIGPPIAEDSQLVCARLCLDREDCSSFFYNADAKACSMSSVRHLTTTGLTEAQGNMYFIMRQGCGEGWTVINGQCYQYVAESKFPPDAQAACEQLGGFLVKIDSDGVNTFSKALYKEHGQFWLGGVDKAKDGSWSWRDGSPVNPVYWTPTQPDNQGYEDCMEQWEEGWNDESCSSVAQPFLCEK